jgi:curved DNA-binding protein CbpA
MVSAAHRVLSDPGKRAMHDAAAAATRARRAMATGAGHGGHQHAPHGRYYTAPRPAGSSASSGTGPSQWAPRPWTTTSGSGGMTYASYGAAAEAAQAAAAAKATQAAAAEQARWRAFYAAPPRTADGATSSSTASGASHY